MGKQRDSLSHCGNEMRRHQNKVRYSSRLWLLLFPSAASISLWHEICSTAPTHVITLTFRLAGRRVVRCWATNQHSCMTLTSPETGLSQEDGLTHCAHRGDPTRRRHKGPRPSLYSLQKSPEWRKDGISKGNFLVGRNSCH